MKKTKNTAPCLVNLSKLLIALTLIVRLKDCSIETTQLAKASRRKSFRELKRDNTSLWV